MVRPHGQPDLISLQPLPATTRRHASSLRRDQTVADIPQPPLSRAPPIPHSENDRSHGPILLFRNIYVSIHIMKVDILICNWYSPPMAKADDSKGKTLTAAVKLFRQQGYHGTALHDILKAGGAPRGSLYFHFPKGKEEIGAGALSLAGEAVRQAIVQAAEKSDSAESFLVRIVRAMAADLERSGYREGCPIATTALETAAQSEVLGAATRTAFQKWELEIKRGLFRFGLTSGDADLVATMVLSQIEGALLLARTYRSLAPIQRTEEAVRLLAYAAKSAN
ncbi:TetR/AcrR family transcriptional regulator [Bradyrhizobium roseum]|uniref:TetR/AcrR family transcriptional regulator n=1 Tax=Bradyrhizobium roseum TaxID=3056648 RepID=UPI002634E7A3|nr:TetR/AcrR family transcriptional regulator [Bradyrhizobium roseus]WKA28743.1 TetR/AcrR family transcriptional regulator [Bradyrhizobium roseus]